MGGRVIGVKERADSRRIYWCLGWNGPDYSISMRIAFTESLCILLLVSWCRCLDLTSCGSQCFLLGFRHIVLRLKLTFDNCRMLLKVNSGSKETPRILGLF